MYIHLNLLEHYLSASLTQHAAKALLANIDRSDFDNILYMLGFEEDEFAELDMKSRAFQRKLKYWAINQVEEAYWNIENKMHGDVIRVYRVITAPPEWTPDDRHPGIYWSWDEHAAEAHWGSFGTGHVKWRLVADVSARQINWVSTLAANGSPDMESEKEITLRDNVPVKLISHQQIR